MANADPAHDDLNNDFFDSHSPTFYPSQPWNMSLMDQMDNMQHTHDPRRHISPIQTSMATMAQNTMAGHSIMNRWEYEPLQMPPQQQHSQQQHLQHQQQQQHHHHHHHHQAHQHLSFDHDQSAFGMSYTPFPMQMPTDMAMVPVTQSMSMDQASLYLQSGMDHMQDWGLAAELVSTCLNQEIAMPPVSPGQPQTGSPISQHSSTEDWTMIEPRMSFESGSSSVFVNPQTLHNRTLSSNSSSVDCDQSIHQGFQGWDIGSNHAVYSPTNNSDSDEAFSLHSHVHIMEPCSSMSSVTMNADLPVRPSVIPPSSKGSSPGRSPSSQGSAGSPGRKGSNKKSSTTAKATDRVQKKTSTNTKLDATEKRVGRRKGPLKPEQRKQAGEIRKLRACLRCKFLKKTCDKGEPCAGCQPSHARLWQVPCTRIDIKEIGYFLKDKRFDYERHVSLGFSIGNIKGFSDEEKILQITHGYGHMLPVMAREVYVRDEKCLKMDWIEANRAPDGYEVSTAKLSAGSEGISTTMLSDYLDRHIDVGDTFEKFVDDYFEGTPFLSQMLKVAWKFYDRTKSPIIKKALKLMLAYTLTVHITMVADVVPEEGWVGRIDNETSRFHGKTMAPVMINFQIKCAMADMWRELHKDVLEELSSLYSSVYSGDKLKNWPTIFILASVLLAVWECMQFDCHYRVPDESAVDKFCADMESTPVGVIVGLFSAISQKLPSVLEWDTSKHHALLGSDRDVCDTMTEVRQHVAQYESYLRNRPNAKFDSKDFDCLSNKFLSRLVLRDIRAN